MDKEDLEIKELLAQTEFKEDPDKGNRIEELKFVYLGIANAAKPARKIKGKKTTSVSRPTLTSEGSSSHAKRKDGLKSRIITDWTRHGIFYAQAITVTPVQGLPRIHTGGPGVPSGVRTGDGYKHGKAWFNWDQVQQIWATYSERIGDVTGSGRTRVGLAGGWSKALVTAHGI